MANLIKALACIGLMVLFYAGLRWLITGISRDFGYGLAAGAVGILLLMWIVKKLDPDVKF